MGKLVSFNFISADGYYKGPDNDTSWSFHGAEESEYAAENSNTNAILLFGRVTYEMMAGYWPTPIAMQNTPEVAAGMNKSEKIVFSRTMKKATWSNTKVVTDNIVGEVKKLKDAGRDMAILGSGSILTQFAEADLIDEYQLMINPVLLGTGASVFAGIGKYKQLKLVKSQTFKSGVVLLCYESKKL